MSSNCVSVNCSGTERRRLKKPLFEEAFVLIMEDLQDNDEQQVC